MIPPDEARFCPYVGLQPFTEAHRPFFFGRERDQRVIVSNIRAVPLTILYGPSGVGKSSVLFAGVVPHLKERNDCAVAVFRDWQEKSFTNQLKKTCIAAVTLSDDADSDSFPSLTLDDLLYQLGETSRKSICVIFDQFEEYFFYHPGGPLSDAFEGELARAINRDEVDVNFLIALREDSVHKLDRFRARIPNLLGNSLRLEQLDKKSAERAITMPLEVYNQRFSTHFSIEAELVKEILDQTGARPLAVSFASEIDTHENREPAARGAIERIETPFLQLVMERLWEEEREKSSVLRLITFQRLGGAKEIARTHLERKLEKLEPEERAVCVEFFDRLVTPSGTKVACRLDDLIQWAGNLAERVPDILKHLEEGRILRRIEAASGGPPLYEVFHDVLGGAILEWRKQYLKEREIAEATRQADEGRRLAEVETMRVEQERAREARSVAKFRRLSAALAIAFVALAGTLILVMMLFRRSCEDTRRSSLREGIDRAVNFLDSDPERSGIMARDLLKEAGEFRDIEREATDLLSRAIAVSAVRLNFLMGNTQIMAEAYAPERNLLATVGKDGTVKLWDTKLGSLWNPNRGSGNLHLPAGVAEFSVAQARFSPKGELLAVDIGQGDKGDAYVWSVDSGGLVEPLSGVTCFAFSPDGHLIAAGTQSRSVEVWDTASWKLQKRIPLDEPDLGLPDHDFITGIAFDPTGKRIATAHQYGDVMLLDPIMGRVKKLRSKGSDHAHTATVHCVAFSRDGRLGSASADKTAKLWDAETGKFEGTLKGHSDEVNFLEFSPNGKQVITCSQDNDAMVWDAQTGELIHKLSGHTNAVHKASFSPSGKLIASVSADSSVRLWNAEKGTFLFSLKGHNGPVGDSNFSADGYTIFTLGWDGTAKAWDISGEHAGLVNQVLFSQTGKLATAGSDGTAKLWDPVSGNVLQILSGHQQSVQAVAFTSDGTRLATASLDHSVRIWDAVTGELKATLRGHEDAVNEVVYHPKDKNMLATAGLDGDVLLWEAEKPEKPYKLGSHSWQALHVAFSPDGSQLASAGSSGDAFIWDVKSKGEMVPLKDPKLDGAGGDDRAHEGQIYRIAFSPKKGDYVLTCGGDQTAKIWRASDGHLLHEFGDPGMESTAMAASNAKTGTSRKTAHKGIVFDAEFNPQDGQTVVTASLDKTAKIWDVSSGNLLQTLTGHTGPLIAAIFDPAGTHIATASWDGTTKIWEKNQGEALFKEVLTLTSSGQVATVDFSPDGKRIAIGSSTGEVTIFPFDREALMNLANKRFNRPLRPDE
jgi:WD40 repeat protein